MCQWMKLNLICFLIAVFGITSLVYVLETTDFTGAFCKPWHLQQTIHEDSLSQEYLNQYIVYNYRPLHLQLFDSSRTNVFILVDAWGVPVHESKLEGEFALFEKNSHKFALHQRLRNHNKHAEMVEFRGVTQNKIYLFGGDSMEYDRSASSSAMGFERHLFCQKCEDRIMLQKIDSLIENKSAQLIAWTTQSSRLGNADSLCVSLKMIADLALRYPNVQFVVQGTHRPNLGNPAIRKLYKSHWVPVAVLNGLEEGGRR